MEKYRFDNRTIGIPTYESLSRIFTDEDAAVDLLTNSGVFAFRNYADCPFCHAGELRDMATKKWIKRCSNYKCRKAISIFQNTFFQNTKIPINKILELGYLFLLRLPWSQLVIFTGLSEESITNWLGFYRQLVSLALDDVDTQIGGEGIIVEIDETKFGKRKYNRGHRVEGFWVFGGVERTQERKFFAVRVPDRSRQTLEDLITRYIKPGSIIHSDCWKAYNELNRIEIQDENQDFNIAYEHKTVNHSKEFVANDGTHTNRIEATWWALKRYIPKKCDNIDINECLLEHVWRRKNHQNLWEMLLIAFRNIRY